MDALIQFVDVVRTPLLWCGIFFCFATGALAIVSPQSLETANAWSKKNFDSDRFFALFDKSVDTDHFFVRHARLFGVAALATAFVLFLQLN